MCCASTKRMPSWWECGSERKQSECHLCDSAGSSSARAYGFGLVIALRARQINETQRAAPAGSLAQRVVRSGGVDAHGKHTVAGSQHHNSAGCTLRCAHQCDRLLRSFSAVGPTARRRRARSKAASTSATHRAGTCASQPLRSIRQHRAAISVQRTDLPQALHDHGAVALT